MTVFYYDSRKRLERLCKKIIFERMSSFQALCGIRYFLVSLHKLERQAIRRCPKVWFIDFITNTHNKPSTIHAKHWSGLREQSRKERKRHNHSGSDSLAEPGKIQRSEYEKMNHSVSNHSRSYGERMW